MLKHTRIQKEHARNKALNSNQSESLSVIRIYSVSKIIEICPCAVYFAEHSLFDISINIKKHPQLKIVCKKWSIVFCFLNSVTSFFILHAETRDTVENCCAFFIIHVVVHIIGSNLELIFEKKIVCFFKSSLIGRK